MPECLRRQTAVAPVKPAIKQDRGGKDHPQVFDKEQEGNNSQRKRVAIHSDRRPMQTKLHWGTIEGSQRSKVKQIDPKSTKTRPS